MSNIALITGATSGIGLAYAHILAENGWDLIITGRRVEVINSRANELRSAYNIKVDVVIVDFNDVDSFENFYAYITSGVEVGFLVNNVGFSNRNNFFDTDFAGNHKMIEAHISRLTQITHYIVNQMKLKKRGFIVNVSSLVAFLPSLHDPFYSGSKSFITTYSESIALILKEYNIIVQALCPGFTKTDFHLNMNLKDEVFKNRGLKRWMEPKSVVLYSYRKLKLGKVIVIPGIANRMVYLIVKLLPRTIYYKLAGKKKMLNEKR